MSKPRKHVKESFEPKIGFDQCDKELSFSFSELELQGNPPKLESFFSDSEKEVPETPKSANEESESVEQGNVSHGLNHAFFEENSDSASIGKPAKMVKEIGLDGLDEEWTGGLNGKKMKSPESENSEINEIILSNTEVHIQVDGEGKEEGEGETEREREREGKGKRRNKHRDHGTHRSHGKLGSEGAQVSHGTQGTQGIHSTGVDKEKGQKDEKNDHTGRKKKNCCRCASCYIF